MEPILPAYGFELEKLVADKENLERILDNLMEGIIAHDTARRIIFFNRAAEQITGYRREDVIGLDCHTVFGGPFCGERCSFCGGSLPSAWQDVEYSLNLIKRGGEARRIEMKVTGMKDPGGNFVGVLAAFRDVTDLLGLRLRLGSLKSFAGIIGRDYKMLQVYEQIRELALNDYPVHISGETGTGKELVANAVHNESRRGGKPFVPINCGALPEGLLESELFGHVRGAFSGAIRDKKGRFELAHGGTIFLDEIGDLPKAVQVKLLRVIQEGKFERVGVETTVSVDVRIISATNLDLKEQVKLKNFREDLYYRINVVPVHLPPLRERKNDIPLLVEHFLKQASEEGRKEAALSRDALSSMLDYSWPGNVRELQSAVRFALVRAKGRVIETGDLPLELREGGRNRNRTCGPSKKLDQKSVRSALLTAGGNRAKAARALGVGRATLYRFLSEYPDVS